MTNRSDVVQRIKIYSERGNHAYPLSELQAAVLLPQLDMLAERNQRRLRNAAQLLEQCRENAALEPVAWDVAVGCPAFYKLGFLFRAETQHDGSREWFLAAVRAEGVAMDEGFRGFALRSARRCRQVGGLDGAREAARATVLLHHPVLLSSSDEVRRVAQALDKVCRHLPSVPGRAERQREAATDQL